MGLLMIRVNFFCYWLYFFGQQHCATSPFLSNWPQVKPHSGGILVALNNLTAAKPHRRRHFKEVGKKYINASHKALIYPATQ
jgi:hypothetical protein